MVEGVKKNIHDSDMYVTLPIDFDGAPEFQWRKCESAEERSMLYIENALRSDLFTPWFYPVLLEAKRAITDFPRISADGKEIFGDIELHFVNEQSVTNAIQNHLVHVRIRNERSIKIFIPETKLNLQQRDEIESHLGRIREPLENMKYLVLRDIPKDVTEEKIRNMAFPNNDIEKITFHEDARGKRCAVLKFEFVENAIAAHSMNNFVRFDDDTENPKRYRTIYAYAELIDWGVGLLDEKITPRSLMLKSEVKEEPKSITEPKKPLNTSAAPRPKATNPKGRIRPAVSLKSKPSASGRAVSSAPRRWPVEEASYRRPLFSSAVPLTYPTPSAYSNGSFGASTPLPLLGDRRAPNIPHPVRSYDDEFERAARGIYRYEVRRFD